MHCVPSAGRQRDRLKPPQPVQQKPQHFCFRLTVSVGICIWASVVEVVVVCDTILRASVSSRVSASAAVLRAVVLLAGRVASNDSTVSVSDSEVRWAICVEVNTTLWSCTAGVRWDNADWQVESVYIGNVVVVLTTWNQGELGERDWWNTWLSAAQTTNARSHIASFDVLLAEVTVSST